MFNIKQFIPAILLTIAYVGAEYCLPSMYALIVVVALSVIDIVYSRIVEKRFDWLVVFLAAVFCLPEAVNVWAAGSLLHKNQGLIIEAIFCVTLAFIGYSKTKAIPRSLSAGQVFTTEQMGLLKKVLRRFFVLLLVHILLCVVAQFTMPQYMVEFIETYLLYIILGLFFLGIFAYQRWKVYRYSKEEWLPIVNEKGEVQGKAPRSVCHSGSKLMHPVVHLHILDGSKAVFLQKRSMKKIFLPGKWDTSVGGHIGINEKVEEALHREAREELGITKLEAKYIGNYVWNSPREKELVFSFLCVKYDTIHIDNDEVDEGRFWTIQEIENGIKEGSLTPNFIHEYQNNLKKYLK